MATLMRGLLIGLAVLATTSCHSEDENEKLPTELNGKSPPHSNEHTVVDGLVLTLELDKGRCRLAYDEAVAVRHVPLDLPIPVDSNVKAPKSEPRSTPPLVVLLPSSL